MARRLHTTLVAGVTEPASATTFRNEIVVWAPDGRIVGTFEKVHRVPFGEYVPYRSFISHFADLSEVPTDAVPGHGTGPARARRPGRWAPSSPSRSSTPTAAARRCGPGPSC